jgi:cobyrinic acid a,c-diamide synthase
MGSGRLIISALRGGSGKTIISVGLIAALEKKGISTAPFKKGPDYIDAGWLAYAAGRPCYNLDTFLIPEDRILASFKQHTSAKTLAVIEGNRGLYDCINLEGNTSTAELAKLLDAPVILALDCTKTTRTMAAVILGLQHFDPEVNIAGVVLNQTAGARHIQILTHSIEHHCGIPVLGALPKIREEIFPERHMGLVPAPEHAWAKESIERVVRTAESHLDLDRIIGLSGYNPMDEQSHEASFSPSSSKASDPSSADFPVIGVIKDSAFQFYYPENLEALEKEGSILKFISPLESCDIPNLDGLYIGGGFPETHSRELSQNVKFKSQLKILAEKGLPIYAECGGLMYLGEALILDGISYPMAGVLPVVFGFFKKPQGHGYTIVQVNNQNPFYEKDLEFRGHEFHYSKVIQWGGSDADLVFTMKRGAGFINGRDGVCYKNLLATYTHIHALGLPSWARAMVRNASAFKKTRPS